MANSRVKFMTFNIRHDHHPHSNRISFAPPPTVEMPFDCSQFKGEQPWSIRKWKIVDTILLYSPDILGLQEPVIHQIQDIEALLGEEYSWVGAGRNDGNKEGEFTAVFYKRQNLTVQEWKTIWLSSEPEVPGSIGWDAKHPRIATQVTFKHNHNDNQFTVFNAHLDHKGVTSRAESAKLILDRARENCKIGPVFLIGDLNSTEDDPAYITLTNSKYGQTKGENDTLANLVELNQACASAHSLTSGQPVRITNGNQNQLFLPTHRVIRPGQILANLKQHKEEIHYFNDTQYELTTRITSKGAVNTLSGPYGFRDTFTSFGEGDEFKRAPIRIDFIMSLQSHDINVHQFAVLPNQFDDGMLISDHRPVLANLSW